MANPKLMKVMEYLINEQEDKARDLLHQIFIEKARAIHEEMMMHEEPELGGDQDEDLRDDIAEIEAEEHYDEDTDMEDEDDVEGAMDDLSDEMDLDDADMDDVDMDVEDDMDMDDEDMDVADDMDDKDMDTDEVDMEVSDDEHMDYDDIGHKLMDVEAAIEELQKEFDAMQDKEHTSPKSHKELSEDQSRFDFDEMDEQKLLNLMRRYDSQVEFLDTSTTPKGRSYASTGTDLQHLFGYVVNGKPYVVVIDFESYDDNPYGEISKATDRRVERMGAPTKDHEGAWMDKVFDLYTQNESWETMDEADEYHDLDESIAAELAKISVAKSGEVGSGKFARAEVSKHSPVPPTQKDLMGAKPVKTGQGKKAQGYGLETAPSSHSMGAGTGRRKDAEDNKRTVSKEGNARALLNKDRSEGFGAPNTKSPIQGR